MIFTIPDQYQLQGFSSILFENDFLALFPELFLVTCTLFLLIYGVFLSTSKVNFGSSDLKESTDLNDQDILEGHRSYPLLLQNISWLSVLSLVFTLLLLQRNFLAHGLLFYGTLIQDDLSLFLKAAVLCGSFFCIIISMNYYKQESVNNFELLILTMLSTCSMLFLISSADFISMYLAIELQSFCFYIMAASKRNSEFSTEAGLKYFLLGAFSSGILLFGCSLIYGFTGVTSFCELSKIFTCGACDALIGPSSLRGCELGMIFIIVGLLFKLTAAPFHMWAADVYEGAPTPVTAFFSIVPKISLLGVSVRLMVDTFYDFMLPWQKIFIFCSCASMIVGALAALSQNRIKRFLAFSSVGHTGYLLVGFCCGTTQGLQALLIYLLVYICMTLSLFTIVLTPVQRNVVYSVQRVKFITDFAQLGQTNPLLAFTLTVTMFSIAGIPPLAGFYSKAYLFFAAMSSGMYVLAFIGVLTSVLSCFYYIRLVKIMYFESSKNSLSFSTISHENSLILGLTLLFLLCFLIYPSPLFLATHKVALAACV